MLLQLITEQCENHMQLSQLFWVEDLLYATSQVCPFSPAFLDIKGPGRLDCSDLPCPENIDITDVLHTTGELNTAFL